MRAVATLRTRSFAKPLHASLVYATLLLCVSIARADVTFMDTTIEMDDWTFLPAADEDAERVEAFLAVKTGGDLIGNNIAVVLYARHADDSWERLAWTDNDDTAAMVSATKTVAPRPTIRPL